jgi:hypothetical protein
LSLSASGSDPGWAPPWLLLQGKRQETALAQGLLSPGERAARSHADPDHGTHNSRKGRHHATLDTVYYGLSLIVAGLMLLGIALATAAARMGRSRA